MSSRRASSSAATAATTAVAAVLGAWALAASVVVAVTAPAGLLGGHTLEDVVIALAWSGLAVVLARSARPGGVAAVALVVAASAAVTTTGSAWSVAGPEAGRAWARWGGEWTWAPATVLPVALVPLLLLDPVDLGRRGERVRRGLVGAAVAVCTAACAGLATGTGAVVALSGAALLAVTTAGLGLQVAAWVRSDRRGRRRLPLLAATAASALALVVASAVPALDALLQVLAAPLVPLAVADLLVQDLVDELRASRALLAHAREVERERLSDDLHDDLGPLLSAIGAHADTALLRLRAGRQGAEELVERIRAVDEAAVVALRRALADLAPTAADRPLAEALSDLVASLDVGGGSGPRTRLRTRDLGDVPPAVASCALRIAAEALTNAVRHARASPVDVEVALRGRELVLAVSDDGVGLGSAPRTGGRGLASMEHRATACGGAFGVGQPGSGTGTVVTAVLPLVSAPSSPARPAPRRPVVVP
ncbi:hypothetical protein FHN55_06535 [Streptomyces sp. NP160]|uniref:sensor histidine kinase n=1 Tax=Streptomyces sp. NP160 TaxID=2586637 RepID=UPI001119C972|nr:histidine kinase [Streptomyces sp. NP160]TNM68459.1 hypothetical protein FHN55_06535 [Streptomyces sp. NP160]